MPEYCALRRIDQPDDWRSTASSHIHHPADLAAVGFPQGSSKDGEILSVNENRAPIHAPIPGNHSIAHMLFDWQALLVTNGHCIGLDLLKSAGVKQHFQAFTGSMLPFGMLPGNPLCPTTLLDLFPHRSKF
jgi:hypothetical protein